MWYHKALSQERTMFDHPENFQGEIQVSGLKRFPQSHWRQAILHFLFGVWGEKQDAMQRPKISFKQFTLRLEPEFDRYVAYQNDTHIVDQTFEEFLKEAGLSDIDHSEFIRVTAPAGDAVELALIRFAKCNRIRVLAIEVLAGTVFFAKQEDRGTSVVPTKPK